MQTTWIARAVVVLGLLGSAGCDSTPSVTDGGALDSGGMPLPVGEICTHDSDCSSMICKDRCCNLPCSSDPTCGVTGCDITGACIYPLGIPCGSTTCAAAQLTGYSCKFGSCTAGAPQQCPDNFGCGDASVCATTCVRPSDCAAQNYCLDGGCLPKGAAGTPCDLNAACLSGTCGARDGGSGLCCSHACPSSNPTCGATGCDDTGGCIYPDGGTSCSIQSCDAGFFTEPAGCDGTGNCPAVTGHCAPYACANDTCATNCTSTAGCIGAVCDPPSGTCCPNFTGNTIYVDGFAGLSGQPCCGRTPGGGACAYLADAVRLAGDSQVSGMILSVASAPLDAPTVVQLSYGVIVQAPGVDLPPLQIARFPSDTSISVTVEGAMGLPASFAGAPGPEIAIGNGMTLHLLNASIASQNGWAVDVGPGGALKLGNDGAGNLGTVLLGGPPVQGVSYLGISCHGSAAAPASVDDLPSATGTSLLVQGVSLHLQASSYCTVNLVNSPVFGTAPPCGEGQGLLVAGNPSVTISNASFQCFGSEAIRMAGGEPAGASVTGSFNTIKDSRTGVWCGAGTFAMTDTTITGNSNGVIEADDSFTDDAGALQTTTGNVDLSGGGNQVTCNDNALPGTTVHVDVLNATADAGLNARNVFWDAWDDSKHHTQRWRCDPTFTTCTCFGAASCRALTSIPNDADTVTFNGILVDDIGGSLFPAGPGGACP
jgi:hypothetical protein